MPPIPDFNQTEMIMTHDGHETGFIHNGPIKFNHEFSTTPPKPHKSKQKILSQKGKEILSTFALTPLKTNILSQACHTTLQAFFPKGVTSYITDHLPISSHHHHPICLTTLSEIIALSSCPTFLQSPSYHHLENAASRVSCLLGAPPAVSLSHRTSHSRPAVTLAVSHTTHYEQRMGVDVTAVMEVEGCDQTVPQEEKEDELEDVVCEVTIDKVGWEVQQWRKGDIDGEGFLVVCVRPLLGGKETEGGGLTVSAARIVQVNAIPPTALYSVDMFTSYRKDKGDISVRLLFKTKRCVDNMPPKLQVELVMSKTK